MARSTNPADLYRALTAGAGSREELRGGFHIEAVRNEVVGEQTGEGEQAPTRSSADVYVFEGIGGWGGVTAEDFVRDVAGLDVDHIDLHLNSPGGAAFEGVAIANVLRQHRAHVTVWVDGVAASAASVIAMAGDEVVMGVGAQMMIHDASLITFGNAAELAKDAEMAGKVSDSLAATYAAKAGGTAAEWRAVMQAETWYTAEEAVAAGLADRVATAEDKGKASGEQVVPGSRDSFLDLWNTLSDPDRHTAAVKHLFQHAGRDDAPPPRIPAGAGVRSQTPAATASGSTHKERSTPVPFTDAQLATLRTTLGLAADASEDKIVSTVAEVMTEFVKEPPTNALPEGAVPVDKAVFEQLRADAAAGREAREEQQASRREQLVTAAINDGRIAPSSKDGWLNALKTDPDGEKNLASLAPGLLPVSEIGHADNDAATDLGGMTADELDAWASASGLPEGALRG